MPTLLEKVAALAGERRRVEGDFCTALRNAKEVHSWAELAAASGLSSSGVRHLVEKGESNGDRDGNAGA